MFRVDVYAQEGKPRDKANLLPPAYACLATAAEGSEGRLFTVGRKNATFLLESDKSVSRDHTHIHLLSNNKDHKGIAGIPSSSEEKEACSLSRLGMTLLVKNFGKFGTAVLAFMPNTGGEENKPNQEAAENDSETDPGGSDTEDESQKKNAKPSDGFSLPELVEWHEDTQKIAAKLFQNKRHKLVASEKLEAKQSKIIPGNATTIIVQVGQHGSTFVLTRMDLKIFKSSWKVKSDDTFWKKEIFKIGGELVDENVEDTLLEGFSNHNKVPCVLDTPLPPTTYLCCPHREVSQKQLVAWNLGFVPFVTLDFLRKLLGRNSVQDPWPNIQEYEPPMLPNTVPKDLDENFWKAKTSTQLWKSCTFLSTNAQQRAQCAFVVKAAGGSVILLDKMTDKEAKEAVCSLLANPEKKDGLFTSNGGKRNLVKWMVGQGIPQIHSKKMVLSFCKQSPLKDENDRILGKVDEMEQETSPEKQTPDEEKVPPGSSDSEATEGEEETKPEKKIAATKSSGPLKEDDGSGDEIDKKRESDDAVDRERSESQPKRRKNNDNETQSQRQSQSQRHVDILPSVQEEESMNLDDSALSEEVDAPVAKGKKRRAESQMEEGGSSDERKRTKATESQSRRQVIPGSARLACTKDGWLVTAPKNSADREAYLRPKQEISDGEGNPQLVVVAETITCSGLIHRPYDPNRENTTITTKSRTGVDYKRFKKNKIIASGRNRVALKAVQPKESKALQALEEQQKAIDAQERLADDLFADERGKKQSKISSTRTRRNG